MTGELQPPNCLLGTSHSHLDASLASHTIIVGVADMVRLHPEDGVFYECNKGT